MTDKICSICTQPYEELGNNAAPINDGRCCNECDVMFVLPARLLRLGYKHASVSVLMEQIKSGIRDGLVSPSKEG